MKSAAEMGWDALGARACSRRAPERGCHVKVLCYRYLHSPFAMDVAIRLSRELTLDGVVRVNQPCYLRLDFGVVTVLK